MVVSSKWGEVQMEVRLLAELRDDSVLAYSGSAINHVTPPHADNHGNNAIFQEVKVNLKKESQ